MTLKEFFKHLKSWISVFPNPFHSDETIPHMYIGDYGVKKHTCWICGRIWYDE